MSLYLSKVQAVYRGEMDMAGNLFVVALPIGCAEDVTERAKKVLADVAVIAAEDTREAAKWLHAWKISTPCWAVHDHNEADCVPKLIERLLQGEHIALVSDAGTPLISDPGYKLVSAAHQAGIRIVPVPGSCAAIAALSAAGIATDRFLFEGFLPAKSQQRQSRLHALVDTPCTLVFYEAPHRILETLQDMQTVFGGERLATLARELTKTFETIRRDSLATLAEWVASDSNQQRGEIVLVVAGAPAKAVADSISVSAESLLSVLVRELPVKQASSLAAEILGLRKNALYELAQTLKQRQA